MGVFFAGIIVFASVLMLRQPMYFIFMISGFFYASVLRPLPLTFVGVFVTSVLVNTLIGGIPQHTRVVGDLPGDHQRPDRGDRGGDDRGREGHRAERGAPAGAREAGGRAVENAAFTPSC